MEEMEHASGVAVGPSSAPASVLVTPVTSAAPPASLPTEQGIASHHMATASSASAKVGNAGMVGGGGAVFTVGNAGVIGGGGGAVFTTATTMTPASAGAVHPTVTTAASSLGIIGSSSGLAGSSPGIGGSTSGMGIGGLTRKKRGRPRKYGPDGSVLMPLNPMPISASMPPGEFTLTSPDGVMLKRGRGRPAGSINKRQFWRPELDSLGSLLACATGPNFTPHVINIAAGEDVTMKIISFSQQGPKAICILSANGIISNVTLRQPDSSGGTLTYEGRFELVSLSGSFLPTESGGTRGRSGGMSVSLASPDGRVVGGGVAGLLVAASPVQVVIGSFMPNYQSELKAVKKSQPESFSIGSTAGGRSIADIDESFGIIQGQRSSGTPKVSNTASFRGDSWASLHSLSDTRNTTDINISLPGGVTS